MSDNQEIPRDTKSPEIVTKAIDALTANPRNARTHSESQVKKIMASIEQFGFTNPILVDAAMTVLAGHGRLMAAKKLGMKEVPTICLSHLTKAQARAYMLADNRIAIESGWDADLLKMELLELKSEDFDLSFTGFDSAEIDGIFRSKSGKTDENEIPEAPATPVSQLGDIWLLGGHRVRCGSSTDPEGVRLLLAGNVPHLMVTDPPYGVEYDPAWRNRVVRTDGSKVAARAVGQVLNDDNADWREAWALFPGDVAYVWHAGKFGGIVQESLEVTNFDVRAQIIWNKNVFAIGRSDFHWKHEPCLYVVRKGGKSHWNGSRKESTVWDIDKPQKSETGHSTQKPVECMRRPIVLSSKQGDKVYDPFLGSGTTIIAAQMEGRSCFGSELNPAYVDIIVTRWEQYTGLKAVHENGKSFAAIKKEREAKAA